MSESYKERWQQFFEQAQDELGDVSFDVLAKQADEFLADDEARLIDEAYEWSREP